MKALKIALVLIAVVCILPALCVKEAKADAWVTCNINLVGQAWDTVYVQLTDATGTQPAVNQTWYVLNPTYVKELLATALTAMTNNKQVKVYVNNIADGGTVYTMYMLQ